MQKPAPVVSVCIISFNQSQYIEQCIRSVLDQSFESFEVVVHDDCSTDGTWDIIERMARTESRLRPFRQTANLGFQANARSALVRCSGAFTAICEGDDFWISSDKLAKQIALLERYNAAICFSSACMVDKDGIPIGEIRPLHGTSEVETFKFVSLGGEDAPTASMVIRTDILHGLPDDIYTMPVLDFPMQVLAATRGAAVYLDEHTCARRVQAVGSWTESMARDDSRYVIHHEESRRMQAFLEKQTDPSLHPALESVFALGIKNFYRSNRYSLADKRKNFRLDWNRANFLLRISMILFTFIPGLSALGSKARRLLTRTQTAMGTFR